MKSAPATANGADQVPKVCRHCKKRYPNKRRGLCYSCYYTRGVRELYPSTSKFAGYQQIHEPTEAQLNAIIARQRAALPA